MALKLWGGRFTSKTASTLEKLNSSIEIDLRLYEEDIEGSIAYAKCLQNINLLTKDECESIEKGLLKVREEWATDSFLIKESDEDIHTANERRLTEIIGEPALKLHVGRSRNDQIVTDMKLWLKKAILKLHDNIKRVIEVMNHQAELEIDVLIPGYTHLQKAQIIRYSHWLLSHAWSLKMDGDKLTDLYRKTDILPLGSGALAGHPFDINRRELADLLQFSKVSNNSLHTVGDRDFVLDFLYWCSVVGLHLSRLAEDMILYSTKEFNFIKLDDSFSTGSSLMPQKRNPDSLELIRGIGGSLFGNVSALIIAIKGLPSTYNKDLQSDKEYMFSSFDKLTAILDVAEGVIKSTKINYSECADALSYEMLATDLAYYLVRKNIPFRQAHHIAGQVVTYAEKRKVVLNDLTLEELHSISQHFDSDVAKIWNFENSVEQYQSKGGTSKLQVTKQIEELKLFIKSSF